MKHVARWPDGNLLVKGKVILALKDLERVIFTIKKLKKMKIDTFFLSARHASKS